MKEYTAKHFVSLIIRTTQSNLSWETNSHVNVKSNIIKTMKSNVTYVRPSKEFEDPVSIGRRFSADHLSTKS